MIAPAFPPHHWLDDCTDRDQAELLAAGVSGMADSLQCSRLEGLHFVSLTLPDHLARIAARADTGGTVIALGTIGQPTQRTDALAAGACEFLVVGPLDRAQLAARLRLLATGEALPAGLVLHASQGVLALNGREHELSDMECGLLDALMEAKGGFVLHDELLKTVWQGRSSDRQHLRVAINRLRRRIEPEPDLPRYLLSEPGIGYRIGCPD